MVQDQPKDGHQPTDQGRDRVAGVVDCGADVPELVDYGGKRRLLALAGCQI